MAFVGWYDPDRKKPARQKLAEALERHQEKFGRPARFCVTSPQDAAELVEPTRKHPGELPVGVQARGYIARWTFYVGEGETDEQRGAGTGGDDVVAPVSRRSGGGATPRDVPPAAGAEQRGAGLAVAVGAGEVA